MERIDSPGQGWMSHGIVDRFSHIRKLQWDFRTLTGPWCLLVENRDEWGSPFRNDFRNELLKKMGGQPPLKDKDREGRSSHWAVLV